MGHLKQMAGQKGLQDAWAAVAGPWLALHSVHIRRHGGTEGPAGEHRPVSAAAVFKDTVEDGATVRVATQLDQLQHAVADVSADLAHLVRSIGCGTTVSRALPNRANATLSAEGQQADIPQWVRQPLWAAPAASGSSTDAAPSAEQQPDAAAAAETGATAAAPPPEPKIEDKNAGELPAADQWQFRGMRKAR